MKTSIRFLTLIFTSILIWNISYSQSSCPNQLPSVVSNPEFTVYQNPTWGSRPMSDVCEWKEAFGVTWHNSSFGTMPACAVIETNSTVASETISGIYQSISLDKGAELDYAVTIAYINGSPGKTEGHINHLVVCLTNENPEGLIQGNQLITFSKQILLELNDIDLELFTHYYSQQPIVASDDFEYLLVYHIADAGSQLTTINISKVDVTNNNFSKCFYPKYIGRSSNNEYKGHQLGTMISYDRKYLIEGQETNCMQVYLPDGHTMDNPEVLINCYDINGLYNWSSGIKGGGHYASLHKLPNYTAGVIYRAGYGEVSINNTTYSGYNSWAFLLICFNNNGEVGQIREIFDPTNGLTTYHNKFKIVDNKLYFIVRNTIAGNFIGDIELTQAFYYLITYDLTTNTISNANPLISSNHDGYTCGIEILNDNAYIFLNNLLIKANLLTNNIVSYTAEKKYLSIGISLGNVYELLVANDLYSYAFDINSINEGPKITQTLPQIDYFDNFNYPNNIKFVNQNLYYTTIEVDGSPSVLGSLNAYDGTYKSIYETYYNYNPSLAFAISADESKAYVSMFKSACIITNPSTTIYNDSSTTFVIDIPTIDTFCRKNEIRALYLYSGKSDGTTVITPGFINTTNEELINTLESFSINTVFLALKREIIEMPQKDRELYLNKIIDFVNKVHEKGWQVHAHPQFDFCDYENYNAKIKPFVDYFKLNYQGNNTIPESAKFDGFHTDFEPFTCVGWSNDDGFQFENDYIMPVYYATVKRIRVDLSNCYWPFTSTEGQRYSGTSFWKWPYYSNPQNITPPLNASISTLTSSENFDFVMPMNFRGTCVEWFDEWYYSTSYQPSPIDEGPMIMTIAAGGQYTSCDNNALDNRAEIYNLQDQMQSLFYNKENYLGSCIFDYKRMLDLPEFAGNSGDERFESLESISDAFAINDDNKQLSTSNSAYMVWPNPFTETINIESIPYQKLTIKIYNFSMDMVLFSDKELINTKSLGPGIYLLNLYDENENVVYRTKMVKK